MLAGMHFAVHSMVDNVYVMDLLEDLSMTIHFHDWLFLQKKKRCCSMFYQFFR